MSLFYPTFNPSMIYVRSIQYEKLSYQFQSKFSIFLTSYFSIVKLQDDESFDFFLYTRFDIDQEMDFQKKLLVYFLKY